ncbi:CDP-diacylglycerol--serine O-phosphatidyltransferase [Litchfieldia alkalitelluris]|uniref:CDP-diacylglycerol--serine O-phosphatidyltransferase n=1 Tax=Litchfieldia alkalitelluris TaxID=304268 RepID=UPI0011170BD0|nr:CDP-diacylglycerol--serine O-phosphatidyltransferase [Litchfieldia alkalitelluris]
MYGKWFKKSIPNLFTLCNLYVGFLSIFFAANGDFRNASILILIGMMLDSMDGRLARLLNAQSEIGKELDSLADVVTFGVAPSVLVYFTTFSNHGLVGLLVAGMFPLFGAFRLARFNVTSKNSMHYFTGIPITAAGGILTLVAMLEPWVPSIVITSTFVALSFLMVSKIKIPSFKDVPIPKYGTIVTTLFILIIFLVYRSQRFEYPIFFYIAIALYILFMGYHFRKTKNQKKSEAKK